MKPERQFRLFSIAILALAALACIQENDKQPIVREMPSAQLEVDAIKEIHAMNDEAPIAKSAASFAYGKPGFGD